MDEDRTELLDAIAGERLARIDERRAAAPQSALRRAQLRHLRNPDVATPEELILRAWVDGTDRDDLVERLSAIKYTYGEYAPYPAEGKTASTWDQVRQAHMSGFLSGDEVERIEAASRPKPSIEARFVHSRALNARGLAGRVAREADRGSLAREVASRQELLLNAIEELAVMHGREAADHCTGCGDPYPCITMKRIASVWANDIAFDETMGINNHRP